MKFLQLVAVELERAFRHGRFTDEAVRNELSHRKRIERELLRRSTRPSSGTADERDRQHHLGLMAQPRFHQLTPPIPVTRWLSDNER